MRARKPLRAMLVLVLVLATATCRRTHDDAGGEQQATALPAAHAHNDYQHARPLLDALAHGFTSIEADVWLVDGTLLVAHDREQARPERTLEALYLRPLEERARRGHGRVFAGWSGSVQLLIDIKSEAEPTYRALHAALAAHSGMLSSFSQSGSRPAAVSVVVSGNRPRALMLAQELRYAAYDGRLDELDPNTSPTFMPLVSDNWSRQFAWNGSGPQPAAERAKLRELVGKAHAQGRRLRFWGTPETPGAREAVWQQLRAAGVDHLNSDDLHGLEAWLRKR